jgi:hypothetical protein
MLSLLKEKKPETRVCRICELYIEPHQLRLVNGLCCHKNCYIMLRIKFQKYQLSLYDV